METTAGPLSLVTTPALRFAHIYSLAPRLCRDRMHLRFPDTPGLALATIALSSTEIQRSDAETTAGQAALDVPANDKL